MRPVKIVGTEQTVPGRIAKSVMLVLRAKWSWLPALIGTVWPLIKCFIFSLPSAC